MNTRRQFLLRARSDSRRRVPHGVTVIGRLFDHGVVGRVGVAPERALRVAETRPAGF